MIVKKEIIDKVIEEFIGDSVFTIGNSIKKEAIRELKSAVKNAALIEIKINATTMIASAVTEILKKEFLQRRKEDTSTILDTIYNNFDTPKDWEIFNFNGTPIVIIAPPLYPYPNNNNNYMPYRKHKIYSTGTIPCDNYNTPNAGMPNISDGSYRLITFKSDKNLKNIHKFVNILIKKGLKRINDMENSPYIRIISHCDGTETTVRKRFMNSVFMNTETKKELMISVANFVNKRDWYDKNMIPYHYGIMLYGPSGTGKSTLIRAFISTYVEKLGLRNMENPLYLRSPSEMLMNPNDMSFSDTKYPRIIIIEDIDATILKKREKKEEENNNNNNEYRPYFQQSYQDDTSLSEILNKLDGLTNLENVIYIFTTNHIENLDPALVRPGRIDKLIHIDLPDRCAYNQFCQYHFGKSIPKDFEIKSHKLIAELQSEIVGGKDFDDILKILGKED